MQPNADSLGRRSRTRPRSTGKRITLQERDWLWLQKIHRHGPLPSSYLVQFAKHLGRSQKRAKERLGDLFHENNTVHGGPYLTRPQQQFQTIDSRYNQLAYDLAPAGIKALKQASKWSNRAGPNGGPWWHKLMVSSITSSVELGTIERDDLTFIPQCKILERASTSLSCRVSFNDPVHKKSITKNLQPDALFGLEYHTQMGSRFRFFSVEADRATEPLTSGNSNRKSAAQSFVQYATYIGQGEYKKHLKLTAPLLVLNICSSADRADRMLKTLSEIIVDVPPCVLFQTWDAFSTVLRMPVPNASLLCGPWGMPNGGTMQIDLNYAVK